MEGKEERKEKRGKVTKDEAMRVQVIIYTIVHTLKKKITFNKKKVCAV